MKSMNMMRTYLENRIQYIEIQPKSSKMKEVLSCCVVQGTKMSRLLYTICTNSWRIPTELNEELKEPYKTEHAAAYC